MADAEVDEILVSSGAVEGVRLASGQVVRATKVLSNATPHVTMDRLLSDETRGANLSEGLKARLATSDYSSATTKINVAVRGRVWANQAPPYQ